MSLPFLSFSDLSLQTIIGLIGISLFLSSIIIRVLLLFKIKKRVYYPLSTALFILSFISFSGDSINLYFRGLINDLSITTLILLSYYVIQPDASNKQTRPIFFLILIIGLFFYPTALGIGLVDPYSWGYLNIDYGLFTPLIFLIILAGLMYYALIKEMNLLLLCLVSSTLAYYFGLLESQNIWDYLFDPLIFIYALATIPGVLLSLFKKPRQG